VKLYGDFPDLFAFTFMCLPNMRQVGTNQYKFKIIDLADMITYYSLAPFAFIMKFNSSSSWQCRGKSKSDLMRVKMVKQSLLASDVNAILQWIVGGLYGGYVAANCLKWYWWRFNANGFFWGMTVGVIGALVMPYAIEWGISRAYITESLPLYWWPVLFVLSLAGCFVGTYTAPSTEINVLKSFYKTVRPWGFWKPIHTIVVAEDISFQPNKRFKLDMFNVVLGITGQCCLTLLPMYIVLWLKLPLLITIIILTIIVLILKRTWWNKLED
jgi:SSS family solute:Na+ symporter